MELHAHFLVLLFRQFEQGLFDRRAAIHGGIDRDEKHAAARQPARRARARPVCDHQQDDRDRGGDEHAYDSIHDLKSSHAVKPLFEPPKDRVDLARDHDAETEQADGRGRLAP